MTGVVILALFLGSFVVWILQREKKHSAAQEYKTTDEFIQHLAANALEDAHHEGHISLDFSIDSIKSVERILGEVHEQFLKDPSSVSPNGLARCYGAYIGEVIRRSNPGARWEKGDELGEESYPIIWGPGHSYPMAWCYRRITNGPVDNVWDKYNVLNEQKKGQLHVSGPKVVGESHVWAKYTVLQHENSKSLIPGQVAKQIGSKQ